MIGWFITIYTFQSGHGIWWCLLMSMEGTMKKRGPNCRHWDGFMAWGITQGGYMGSNMLGGKGDQQLSASQRVGIQPSLLELSFYSQFWKGLLWRFLSTVFHILPEVIYISWIIFQKTIWVHCQPFPTTGEHLAFLGLFIIHCHLSMGFPQVVAVLTCLPHPCGFTSFHKSPWQVSVRLL